MICQYGCGREAKYPPRKGMPKWCCESHYSKCPNIIKKNSESNKKAWKDPTSIFNSKEYKLKQSEAGKGRIPWNKNKTKETDNRLLNQSISLKNTWGDKKSYLNSNKYRNHLRIAQNRIEVKIKKSISQRFTIEEWKEKYSFFTKVEEMRYNPNSTNKKEIQVHCKNHNCPNSKERGGWFTPIGYQFEGRKRALEDKKGNDGSYFYCCEKCKSECPLYKLNKDPFEEIFNEIYYTQEEYETWKTQVKKLDNSTCQICGSKKNIHVHHIIPQKIEPFFVLDPVNGICLCEKCHYKYGHKTGTECSTGKLANKIC